MASHKNYHLNANEENFLFLTSAFVTYYIDNFTSGMKSKSIAYLQSGSEHVYWILGFEVDVQSIWVLWTRWLSRMQGQLLLFKGGQHFPVKFSQVFQGLSKGLRVVGPSLYPIMRPLPQKNSLGCFSV